MRLGPARCESLRGSLDSCVEHVTAWGVGQRAESWCPQGRGRRLQLAGSGGEPLGVVRPPAALPGFGGCDELGGGGGLVSGGLEAGFGIRRWVDERRDVPAGGQHELRLAAEERS